MSLTNDLICQFLSNICSHYLALVAVAEELDYKNDIVLSSEKNVVLDEWVGVQAVLRIAYSNKK